MRGSPGFTFAELLAAMLLMAIVIPVAIRGLTIANRAGVLAERKRTAGQLGDCFLSEMIVTDAWRDSDREGDFGEEWPGYRWVLEENEWEEDTMGEIQLTVLFEVQGQEHAVCLSTLIQESEE